MRDNINKVSQRGERLDTLQNKTNDLATSAQGFRRGANRVRKQMWWKDMKMRVCLIVGIIVLLLVIIIPTGKGDFCSLYVICVVLTFLFSHCDEEIISFSWVSAYRAMDMMTPTTDYHGLRGHDRWVIGRCIVLSL